MEPGTQDEPEVVLAAGGLLWRETAEGPRLALVHRARHDDWSLPKGKLDGDEAPDAGALREVREETACEARIAGYAGRTSYPVDGRPKIVFFWTMAVIREGNFEPSEEVDELAWLAPEEALERLSYDGERALVERAAGAARGRS